MKKTVIITGASKGLGAEILGKLLPYYNIATISRNQKPFESDSLIYASGNILNLDNVIAFINQVYQKWGRIDILINNAGVVGEFKELISYKENEINSIIDTNIKGTFFMVKETIPFMTNHGGTIINIGSTRSITGAANKSIYSMSKFALRGLTQCINAEYNSKNIYSTLICPGSFDAVPLSIIARIIHQIINTPKEAHIPEIIIGGKL